MKTRKISKRLFLEKILGKREKESTQELCEKVLDDIHHDLDYCRTAYETLIEEGAAFENKLEFVDFSIMDNGVPYIRATDNIDSIILIFLDENYKLQSYVGISDKLEVVISELKSSLELVEDCNKKIIPEIQSEFIPNVGLVDNDLVLSSELMDLSEFNKLIAIKITKWNKKCSATKVAQYLGLTGKSDCIKTLDLVKTIAVLLTNPEDEDLGKISSTVHDDLRGKIGNLRIDEVKVSGSGRLSSGVSYIECALRDRETPWLVYFIYYDGTNFKAYVPLEGNWLTPGGLFRSCNPEDDLDWLESQGVKVYATLDDTIHNTLVNLEDGDPDIPAPKLESCLAEFSNRFVTYAPIMEAVEEKKKEDNELSSLSSEQLEEVLTVLTSNYVKDFSDLIVKLKNRKKEKENKIKSLDKKQFEGNSYKCVHGDTEIFIKVRSLTSDPVFDYAIVAKKGNTTYTEVSTGTMNGSSVSLQVEEDGTLSVSSMNSKFNLTKTDKFYGEK